MSTSPKPPGGGGQASTHGGPGWRQRVARHADEVAQGRLWTGYRVRSEVAPLRAVLLARPGQELAFTESPAEQLMLERVDLPTLCEQADAVAEFYRAHGVTVHRFRPRTPPPPNFLFQRDLFFMTPEGAVLGRPAAQQRAGEERFAAEALAAIGVPILHSMSGRATFEGADALWIDGATVLVGTGRRTNDEALDAMRQVLAAQAVEVIATPLPGDIQHLLGIVTPLDGDLVAVRADKATDAMRQALTTRGHELLELPADDELLDRRGMNFVTLAPREVVMPAGAPGIRGRLESHGVAVHELEVGEYVKAAGGLGCLTGILWREAS